MKFVRNTEGHVPVEEMLNALPATDARKIVWVLKVYKDLSWIPNQYYYQASKKVDLWEIRVSVESRNYWLTGFRKNKELYLVNGDFQVEGQKAPEKALKEVEKVRSGYRESFRFLAKNDLKVYITRKKDRNEVFAKDFELGYLRFKLGTILRQVRESAGITQKELSSKINESTSQISKVENHSEDLNLDQLGRYLDKLKTLA